MPETTPADMSPGDEAPADRNETAPDICPDCGGDGRDGDAECRTCGGTGEVQKAVGGG